MSTAAVLIVSLSWRRRAVDYENTLDYGVLYKRVVYAQ